MTSSGLTSAVSPTLQISLRHSAIVESGAAVQPVLPEDAVTSVAPHETWGCAITAAVEQRWRDLPAARLRRLWCSLNGGTQLGHHLGIRAGIRDVPVPPPRLLGRHL